jgi:hypothetical protein
MKIYKDDDIDEDMKLTRKDYITILHHYQRTPRESVSGLAMKTLKTRAHKILGDKLCRCIGKDTVDDEGRRIAYCTRSIFNNRGLKRRGFTCKAQRRMLRGRHKSRRGETRKLVGDIIKTVDGDIRM